MTAILDHKPSSWKLSWNISLLAPVYSGVVIFGIIVYLQTLVIREKCPVFMTAFRPLATVIVGVMGLLILGEELYLGSIMGSVLIVLGLYAILWAKGYEKKKKVLELIVTDQHTTIEINSQK
ncbi:WAT1-related protein At5g07050-like [Pistacia vera]|uniref:WAT1-related protein At5g07050-like n=1 Tax=Pistacia vera TaxID=55513 RepID=UPI0012639AB2|nr:WAT1-related protein At5g07050-like [Pistacia vera]